MLLLEPNPVHAARVFWDRTFGWQVGRDSPFSIWGWGQYHATGIPDLGFVQPVARRPARVGAVACYFVPRRKTPLQLAALTAALLIGFELVLTHWFYLYIPWFFPFVAFAVLARGRRASRLSDPPSDSERPESSSPPADTASASRRRSSRSALFLVVWGVLHHGFYTQRPDRRHAGLPALRRRDGATGRCRTATSGSSIRPVRCRCSSCRRSAMRDSETFRNGFEALMACLRRGRARAACAIALVALGAGWMRLVAALGVRRARSARDRPGRALALRPLARRADRRRAGGARRRARPARRRRARRSPSRRSSTRSCCCRSRSRTSGGGAAGARRSSAQRAIAAVVAVASCRSSSLAPGGVWDSLWGQASRPLQIESLGSALLLVAHSVFGTGDHDGVGPRLAEPRRVGARRARGRCRRSLQAAALVAVWSLFARGPADRERLVLAAAAAGRRRSSRSARCSRRSS